MSKMTSELLSKEEGNRVVEKIMQVYHGRCVCAEVLFPRVIVENLKEISNEQDRQLGTAF